MRAASSILFALLLCTLPTGVVLADEKSDAEARRAIEQAVIELDDAYNRGDAKGVAAVYTETAQVFPPNRPIASGRAEIEEFNQAMLDLGFKGMESTLIEIEVFDDVAFAAGTMKLWRDNKSKSGSGKFTLFWKKVDGKWQIHRDCGNSSEPSR